MDIQVNGMYMCLHSYLGCLFWDMSVCGYHDMCQWGPGILHVCGYIGLKGMDYTCMYKACSLFMMLYRTCV